MSSGLGKRKTQTLPTCPLACRKFTGYSANGDTPQTTGRGQNGIYQSLPRLCFSTYVLHPPSESPHAATEETPRSSTTFHAVHALCTPCANVEGKMGSLKKGCYQDEDQKSQYQTRSLCSWSESQCVTSKRITNHPEC